MISDGDLNSDAVSRLTVHSNATDDILTQMLLEQSQFHAGASRGQGEEGGFDATYGDLEDELLVVVGALQGVQNRRKLGGVEFDWESRQR